MRRWSLPTPRVSRKTWCVLGSPALVPIPGQDAPGGLSRSRPDPDSTVNVGGYVLAGASRGAHGDHKNGSNQTGVPAMKKVFTTGQVAKICKVAPRTVSKWFDSGRLKGYRIPGSQDRRIPREQLIKFLKEHGMPLGELEEEEWHKILVIGAEKLFIDRLQEMLPDSEDYRYHVANSGFEAGIMAQSFHPDTIIIDLSLGRSEALQIAANLRRDPAYETTLMIALAAEDEAEPDTLKT